MLADEKSRERFAGQGGGIPAQLFETIGQSLRIHYQDTFLGAPPDHMQKLIDAMETDERRSMTIAS